MTKKTVLLITLIIVVLVVALIIVLLTNPLLRTDKKIREDLLNDLPIGTKMDEVIKYIQGQEKWEVVWIDFDRGFYYSGQRNDPVGGNSRSIGKKSIRVNMGSYKIIFVTDVVVHFGFDENSELIEIWVDSYTDSL